MLHEIKYFLVKLLFTLLEDHIQSYRKNTLKIIININENCFQIPVDSLSSFLWSLFLLSFSCSHVNGSSGRSRNSQTLFIRCDDVIVKSLIKL